MPLWYKIMLRIGKKTTYAIGLIVTIYFFNLKNQLYRYIEIKMNIFKDIDSDTNHNVRNKSKL